jgi:hypothetical protein
VSRHALIPE